MSIFEGHVEASSEQRPSITDSSALVDKAFIAHDAYTVVTELRATGNRYWLAGGAVRDSLLGLHPPNDLDLIVPNGDTVIHQLLAQVGPSRRNRHGNHRYSLLNGSNIDVIEPRNFYRPFTDAAHVVAFFDTSVNAIAVELTSGEVLDPLDGVAHLAAGTVRLPAQRWSTMNSFESAHLVLRLVRLLKRVPLLVSNPSVLARTVEKVLTADSIEWNDLERLHGYDRNTALRLIDDLCGNNGLHLSGR